MRAQDTAWCDAKPKSCGAVQAVLERNPTLVFVNGAFRPRYTLVPPSPPPLPLPPPREFQYLDFPDPSPPPAAENPQPKRREKCVWNN